MAGTMKGILLGTHHCTVLVDGSEAGPCQAELPPFPTQVLFLLKEWQSGLITGAETEREP